MNNRLLIASLLAIGIPGVALAQPADPGCVRANQDNRVAGTVAGAIGGALLGGAIAGHGHQGDGAAVGALGGAVVGNAVAGANNHPCPAGYRYEAPPPPPPHDDRYAAPRHDDDRYAPPPPPRVDRRDFWDGAPEGIHERIDFLQDRVNRATRGGWLSRREQRDINSQMSRLRQEDRRLEYQDGGRLRREDRDYLQSMLDNVSQRLHWAEHDGR
jgi:hypothetical protein